MSNRDNELLFIYLSKTSFDRNEKKKKLLRQELTDICIRVNHQLFRIMMIRNKRSKLIIHLDF